MGLGNCLKEGYKNLWWVMGTYFGVNNIGTSNAKPSKSLSILIKFIYSEKARKFVETSTKIENLS